MVNATAGSSCVAWSDGRNMSASRDPEGPDACEVASGYDW